MLRAVLVFVAIQFVWLTHIAVARAEFAVLGLQTRVHNGGSTTPAIGWEFTPNVPVTVTKLGYYDWQQDGELTAAHEVGIYESSSEKLLVSSLVPAGTAAPGEGPPVTHTDNNNLVLGVFRYVSVPSTLLLPGQDYVVAGRPNVGTDLLAQYQQPLEGYSAQIASEISLIEGRRGPLQGNEFTFPSNSTTYLRDDQPTIFVLFGPTFQFTVVPEPSTLALAGIGGLALVTFAIRRTAR